MKKLFLVICLFVPVFCSAEEKEATVTKQEETTKKDVVTTEKKAVVGLEADLQHMDANIVENSPNVCTRQGVDALVSDIDIYQVALDDISALLAQDFDNLVLLFAPQFDNEGSIDEAFEQAVDDSTSKINLFLEITRAYTFRNSYTANGMAMAMARAMAMAMADAMAMAMAMA